MQGFSASPQAKIRPNKLPSNSDFNSSHTQTQSDLSDLYDFMTLNGLDEFQKYPNRHPCTPTTFITAMDARQSFTFLADNLPSWISKLNELSAQVADRRSEFQMLTQEADFLARRKKNGSTESLRPRDAGEIDKPAPITTQASEPPYQINIDPDSKHFFREARRKRKPGSLISGASGQQKYRSRSMIIVYYDSAIQEGFELLVKNIGSARNNLRKGKTAASFKSRMASLGMDENSFASGGDFGMLNPKRMQPRFTRSRDGPFVVANDPFDHADKDLETAQSLCELGAHQFLRDGDCTEELVGAKQRFEACLIVAEQELGRLNEEERKEKEREEQQQVEEKEGMEHMDSQPQVVRTTVEIQLQPPKHLNNFSGTCGAIEVDDDSDASSVHIDLSAFRSTRRA